MKSASKQIILCQDLYPNMHNNSIKDDRTYMSSKSLGHVNCK